MPLRATRSNEVEQGLDLVLPAVEPLGNQQAVRFIGLRQDEIVNPSLRLPFGEAVFEVVLEAGGGLVAVLGRLGEKLHDDRRHGARHAIDPFGGRNGSSRDVAVHPFHRIGRGERQCAREHPVERHAECVQIAAGIDGPVHAAGLLGRHVGQRARDGLRWLELLSLARQARCEAKSGDPDLVRSVTRRFAGFKSLWTRPADGAGRRRGDGESQSQEMVQLHRRAEQPLERLAAGVFQYQQGTITIADQLQRPYGPGSIELVAQGVFVGEPVVDRGRRMFRRGPYGQDTVDVAIGAPAPFAAKDALAVVP